MARALLTALLVASATVAAQPRADGGSALADGGTVLREKPPAPVFSTAAAPTGSSEDEIRREVEARLEAIKHELREEIRAQMATQSVAKNWQEEWTEEKRKLELLTLDGYFRVRPDLFNKFDMGQPADPAGFYLFPQSPVSPSTNPGVPELERTISGVNMRLRLDPTINVSEEVRIRMQVDLLNNVVMGSTPQYEASQQFSILSGNQTPPQAGINSLQNSLQVERVYGEVSTPVGILRFGRMGSQWGLGVVHNDGNCLDCNYGDTVDRIQFVTNLIPHLYVTPMIDFNLTGPLSNPGPLAIQGNQGQPYPLSNSYDVHSYVIAVAWRDTEQEVKAKLESGEKVLNAGIYFEYRSQKNDPLAFLTLPFQQQPDSTSCTSSSSCSSGALNSPTNTATNYVPRGAQLYMPDIWAKLEKKQWRLELEAASVLGTISNRALSTLPQNFNAPGQDQNLILEQYGGVLEGEYRFFDGKLRLYGEVGFASGEPTPGFHNDPGRSNPNGNGPGSVQMGIGPNGQPIYSTAPGDINGPAYVCPTTGACTNNRITNFQFNLDYQVDQILWREILGGFTSAFYAKPTLSYELADGLKLFGSAIYSQALFASQTPSTTSPFLGVELNAGVRYETEDGFVAQLIYAILFPLPGLQTLSANPIALDQAQALRGWVGIKF